MCGSLASALSHNADHFLTALTRFAAMTKITKPNQWVTVMCNSLAKALNKNPDAFLLALARFATTTKIVEVGHWVTVICGGLVAGINSPKSGTFLATLDQVAAKIGIKTPDEWVTLLNNSICSALRTNPTKFLTNIDKLKAKTGITTASDLITILSRDSVSSAINTQDPKPFFDALGGVKAALGGDLTGEELRTLLAGSFVSALKDRPVLTLNRTTVLATGMGDKSATIKLLSRDSISSRLFKETDTEKKEQDENLLLKALIEAADICAKFGVPVSEIPPAMDVSSRMADAWPVIVDDIKAKVDSKEALLAFLARFRGSYKHKQDCAQAYLDEQ